MEITLTEALGFLGIIVSIVTGVWVIVNRFDLTEERLGTLEFRVGKLEEKTDEILVYIRHKKSKREKRKR